MKYVIKIIDVYCILLVIGGLDILLKLVMKYINFIVNGSCCSFISFKYKGLVRIISFLL